MDATIINTKTESEIEKLKLLIAEQSATIAKLEALNAYYLEQFRLAQRRRFGASSEQIDSDEFRQQTLFDEIESEANKSRPEPEIEEVTYKRKKRVGKRAEDIENLPVERIEHELTENQLICPECEGEMVDIGSTVRIELKIIPAQAVVVEHATHAYKCRDCERHGIQAKSPSADEQSGEKSDNEADIKSTIVRAESPAPLITGSLASPSAVAYIVDQKYGNGMPLYRIEKDLKYKGIKLSRQTMANWVIYCAENFLNAMYMLLIAFMLKAPVLHADETTLQVIHEPGRPATSKSYEWVYRTTGCAEHPIVIYDYKQTRERKHPEGFLRDFKGFLHTDGYQAYHGLPDGIIVVGCWAHARRYFFDLYKTLPKDTRDDSDAARGVAYIDRLFGFEREFANLSPDERYKIRLERSKPVAEEFFAWVLTLGTLPKSLLGKAVGYVLSQRVYLMNVFLDGQLELSNNRCERSVKPFVQGRKAWLFSNTPSGAEASSIMFSIVETARENGLKPYEYIKFLLEKLPTAKTSEIETFLPWSKSLPDYCRLPVKSAQEKHDKTGDA